MDQQFYSSHCNFQDADYELNNIKIWINGNPTAQVKNSCHVMLVSQDEESVHILSFACQA